MNSKTSRNENHKYFNEEKWDLGIAQQGDSNIF